MDVQHVNGLIDFDGWYQTLVPIVPIIHTFFL